MGQSITMAQAAWAAPVTALHALLLLSWSRTVVSASWTLSDSYVGPDFFSKWKFFSKADPTHGAVEYVDYNTALMEGLVNAAADRVYLGADKAAGLAGRSRRSVRIESVAVFNEGLFVVTLDHMPSGCGTWPAFWMFGEDAAHVWPTWGEFDIIEGVHTATRVNTALHTTSGCDQSSIQANWNQGPSKPADNCDIAAPGQDGNQGCSQRGPPNSFGPSFNLQGGGTYAAEWDPVGQQIRTWFWPAGAEPADLSAQRPQPELWEAPFSTFTLAPTLCPASHFQNMRLVFDLTFCGDLGNPTYKQFCPAEAARMTCEELVATRPLPDAYWSIRALDVYARKKDGKSDFSWTRILFAVIAVAATVGAAVLIVRHARESAEHGGQKYAQPHLRHHSGHFAKPAPTQVNVMREAPAFKWQALATSPPGPAGDEPVELGWETMDSVGGEAVPSAPSPSWRPTPKTPKSPFSNILTQDAIQEELELFAAETALAGAANARAHRSPWACGCCRQAH
mmetsp:Transcript_7411/g.20802  ORF Transcript_7411/g.20802 Transcript_7411/m.20802 type:complete len:508 (-) Transcript_7411:143-1666(-)